MYKLAARNNRDESRTWRSENTICAGKESVETVIIGVGTPGIRISPLIPKRQLLYHLIRELTPSNCERVINILGTCVPHVRNVA